MPHYVGLDAGKRSTSICILDNEGVMIAEGEVPTEPAAIMAFLRGRGFRYRRIGIEATGISAWIYEGLARAGMPIILIETRHAHGVLKARRLNKTDRNDARGIADIMRVGIYKAVHMKSQASQEARVALTARSLLTRKRMDIDGSIRGMLLQFGLKIPRHRRKTFEGQVRPLVEKDDLLRTTIELLLDVRRVIVERIKTLDDLVAARAKADPVCRRLMTAPGVGPIVALTFRSAVDIPERFPRSRTVGVHFGITPKTRQSGEDRRLGHISKCGDKSVRTALHLAAKSLLQGKKPSDLATWGREIASKRGYMKGVTAVARRLAVILHRMWMAETDFRYPAAPTI